MGNLTLEGQIVSKQTTSKGTTIIKFLPKGKETLLTLWTKRTIPLPNVLTPCRIEFDLDGLRDDVWLNLITCGLEGKAV